VLTQRLQAGIHLFNSGQYFACHEVLEEEWTPQRGPRRRFLQALIHLAVGWYHAERGNTEGARRQFGKGLRKLGDFLPACEDIDTARLHRDVHGWLERAEAGGAGSDPPRICILTAKGSP
jgi:uncharacterized protein